MMSVKNKKRKVQDVPIFLDRQLFKELEQFINAPTWPYKTNREEYWLRDQALISILILTGVRVTEALNLRKLQFRIYEDHILLANVETKKKGLIRKKIILPLKGNFAPFTRKFSEWLQKIPNENCFIFPSGGIHGFNWKSKLSRQRAHWIIKTATQRFPHWFRGVCETVYGRLIFQNDAWKLKEFMGLKNLDSTTPYVGGSWEEDEKRIFELQLQKRK